MLLRLAKGFGMDNDLMLAIHGGHPVVSLDNTMRGLHLGRFVIRDVAFSRLAGFVIVIFQPFFDFSRPFPQGVHILLFSGGTRFIRLMLVVFPMGGEDMLDSLLQFGHLSFEIRFSAAPLLAGVRRHFAAVDGEHFLAD